MPQTHQTIKLSRGKHRSPADGACVMELASMLAGEEFSDHPASVSPVIGSLLRTYNDSIGDESRQALYGYAAKVVGSRSSAEVEQARAERLLAWASALRRRPARRFLAWWGFWPHSRLDQTDALAAFGLRTLLRRRGRHHREVLALVDELLTIGAGNGTQGLGSTNRSASGRDSLTKGSPATRESVTSL